MLTLLILLLGVIGTETMPDCFQKSSKNPMTVSKSCGLHTFLVCWTAFEMNYQFVLCNRFFRSWVVCKSLRSLLNVILPVIYFCWPCLLISSFWLQAITFWQCCSWTNWRTLRKKVALRGALCSQARKLTELPMQAVWILIHWPWPIQTGKGIEKGLIYC